MKHIKSILTLPALLSLCASAYVHAQQAGGTQTPKQTAQTIMQSGTQASSEGPAEYFTGRVRVDLLFPANEQVPASGAYVTFGPGARSAWHTHPLGQTLVVTQGVGWTQEWGKAIQEIKAGDVVNCPAGIKHWHGATPHTAMTHMTITGTLEGKNVDWMEKVSDEQYQK